VIRLEGVSKWFGATNAVDSVSLEIGAGEFFALLGPSGCGKTTLLRLIGGFELPDDGQVLIDGADMTRVPPWHRPVNTVFQSYALFPHLSVAANIAFGLKQDGMDRDKIRVRVAEMLELVRLTDQAKRKPEQLSGGQRQRVALARSLAKRPRALLLDEPLAALDRKLRDEMQSELVNLQRQLGITFIFVTHDQDEAMTLSTRLAVMRGGRIEQIGTPREIYERPTSRYVADFLGRANVIPGKILGRDGVFLRVETAVTGLILRAHSDAVLPPGTPVWVAVRPENVTIDERGPANLPAGTVRDSAYSGDITRYDVELAGGIVLRALVPNRAGTSLPRPERGAQVRVSWPADAGVLLTR
jgi:putrescine transport system ATP-binding protein